MRFLALVVVMLFEAALRLYQQRTVVLLRLLRPALLLVRPVPQQVHLALLQLRALKVKGNLLFNIVF